LTTHEVEERIEAVEIAGAILVVDDEPAMRAALRRLFHVAKLPVRTFSSGAQLLSCPGVEKAACLVLDVRMPEMDGLQVQSELRRRHIALPTIFLTGAADVPLAVAAMRDGALDFVEKPYDSTHLVQRVRDAMQLQERMRSAQQGRDEALRALATLTGREREVMDLVVQGQTNKEVARHLGTSHRTVDIHRVNAMRKMGANSLADLVRMSLLTKGDPALH